ncbi:hypothetical protein, partial [Planococcus sp. CAU13]|uniref:hypothetical protein n=1 Tax=Planococcus sp. CAU13 TaxID=1541197 RepID=UPI001F43FF50
MKQKSNLKLIEKAAALCAPAFFGFELNRRLFAGEKLRYLSLSLMRGGGFLCLSAIFGCLS